METYADRVFALAVRIVDNPDDAQELTQDIFLKAFSHLSDFMGRSTFSTWLFRIAYNQAMSHARKTPSPEYALDETLLRTVSDTRVDDLLDSDDPRLAALPEALSMLSVAERTLVTLHYLEEMPLNKVAEVMDITENNAKVRLMRTRKKLYLLITKILPKYE